MYFLLIFADPTKIIRKWIWHLWWICMVNKTFLVLEILLLFVFLQIFILDHYSPWGQKINFSFELWVVKNRIGSKIHASRGWSDMHMHQVWSLVDMASPVLEIWLLFIFNWVLRIIQYVNSGCITSRLISMSMGDILISYSTKFLRAINFVDFTVSL